jgi:TolA-binding protein
VPKAPASELREPVNPPQARNRSHFEHSAAEQNNRNAAEGTSQNGAIRPKDKLPEERGTPGREGTAAAGRGSDHPRRLGDANRESDKHADTVKQYQTLFDRQGEVIDTQRERIDALKGDVSKLEKRNEKLEERNDKLQARNDKLRDENDRLRAELATAREAQHSGGASSASDRQRTTEGQGAVLSAPKAKRSWLPGEKAVVLGGSIGTTIGGTLSVAHVMTSGEATIAGGIVSVLVAGASYARSKYEERKAAKNADQPKG